MLQLKEFKKIGSSPFKKKHISEWQTQKLTHQTIHACFVELELLKPLNNEEYFWIAKNSIHQYAFPRTITKYLQQRVPDGTIP